MLFARLPKSDERRAAESFLNQAREQLRDDSSTPEEREVEAWRAYVRVLFRLNEFVYLD